MTGYGASSSPLSPKTETNPSISSQEDPKGIVEFKDVDLGQGSTDDYGGVVQAPVDDDIIYLVEGNKIIGIQEPTEPMGGVGNTPMEMRSPNKNYKNPQDYKVFNFGNEPTPFDVKKEKRKPKRYGSY